ncbi:Arginine metabolism regulation II [Fusarium albosuccineum]|uniref:Arginine metabolism regulation II n=1 Tax=Fusarium albosuccineum TaxID=1237068 RepID=A0A8H4L1T0_9HYPO|nr:Arginine metabolism regulation II [Fusarium albosuccineum]
MHYRNSTTHVAYGGSARRPNADWLAEGLRRRSTISTRAAQPILTALPSWVNPGLDPSEKELFQASLSLTTFGNDAVKIPQILIRMALSDNTPSATAIFMSMLALASFHHDGLQSRVAHFKISALRALSASTKGEVGAAESIRHVAAGMLLCTLEIQQSSAESSHWLWYVCGSKKIIKTAHLDETAHDDDFTTLIGWVQYYDVLARFSLRHWQPNLIVPEGSTNITFEAFQPAVCSEAQPANLVGPSHDILYLLSEVCDTVVPPSDPRYHEVGYREYLKVLEWRLRPIPIKRPKDAAATDSHILVELYQLSTLIYLRRASVGISPERPQTVEWVHRGFSQLKDFETCAHPFPLLIFGCEAYTDEERASILELISRTEISTPFRNLGFVKAILQTIWVQNDLADGHLDYIQNLGVVLSSSTRYERAPA